MLMASTNFNHHITVLSVSNFGMMALITLRALIGKSPKKSSCALEGAVYDFSNSCT